MHLMKLVTFQRKHRSATSHLEPFELTLKYSDQKALQAGTQDEIAKYIIEVPRQGTPKKVKVKALLSLHGTFSITGAQLLEEEAGSAENAPPVADVEAVNPEGAGAPAKATDVE